MTQRSHIALALIFCATFCLPGAVSAASLSPLDPLSAPGAVLPDLGAVPSLSDAPAATGATTTTPAGIAPVTAPQPFKFIDDTGLDTNPLRSVLPENQWANPQAAQNNLIQRR